MLMQFSWVPEGMVMTGERNEQTFHHAVISIQTENNVFIIFHFACVYKTNNANNYLSIYIDLGWS
jgi:hypothetical protein